jgi:hypothetical protein
MSGEHVKLQPELPQQQRDGSVLHIVYRRRNGAHDGANNRDPGDGLLLWSRQHLHVELREHHKSVRIRMYLRLVRPMFWHGLRIKTSCSRKAPIPLGRGLFYSGRMKMRFHLAALLLATVVSSAGAQPDQKPKDATMWFQRAAEQMDLRAFGASPFHMKVIFHAFPGIVLSDKPADQIISGDGTYEETWAAPHEWRREVTFGSYHAVEVESQAGRKMQASSDYEPSRVLMLLEALLYPVPRARSSPLRFGDHPHWRIESGVAGNQSYVKISRTYTRLDVTEGYLFLPGGELLQGIDAGVVTNFTNPAVFHGKLVAQHIQIQGGNKQDLVTADLTVEPAGAADPAVLTLPGSPAEPGVTLRPLDFAECSFSYSGESFLWETNGPTRPLGNGREIIDRHGKVHELEVLYSPDPKNFEPLLPLMRSSKYHPSMIDKRPCEVVRLYVWEPNN